MEKHLFKTITTVAALAVIVLMSGCAATSMAISKRNLDVQTKMSSTVFLDPVAADKRTMVIQVRNTSDKPDFQVEQELKSAVSARGYTIVDDPAKAHFMLQVNILQVGKMDPSAAQGVLSSGFGGAVSGMVLVAAAGSHNDRGVLAGGILGGIASTVADAMVKDVTFSVISDLQISEKIEGGVKAKAVSENKLSQGTSGLTTVTTSKETEWNRYQTRILSSAEKVNLDFDEAEPALVKGLATSVSGIF
ncbi:MAG: complement resistance protein TraT [Sulfuricaulis sp.]